MVCLLPALASLKTAFPDASIEVLCSPVNAALLEHDPNVDRVRIFDLPPRKARWRLAAALLRELRREHYDIVLTFYSRSHTHAAVALSGARVRAGFDSKPFHRFFTNIAHDQGGTHEIDRNFALLDAIGVKPVMHQPRIAVGRDDEQRAREWLDARDVARPLIALHAGAAIPRRRYPADRLAAAVLVLEPASFVIFEGPLDEEESAILLELLPGAHKFKGSLLQMAALLRHCDLAVMNDSGPMHVAAAMDVPVVGIFGPSPVERWAPRGLKTRVVRDPSGIIEEVLPSQITAAALELLSGT